MKYLVLILTLTTSLNLQAQSKFKAGNLSIENSDGGLTIDIKADLFTSLDSQIDSVNICFGDGICEWINSPLQQEFIDFEHSKINV